MSVPAALKQQVRRGRAPRETRNVQRSPAAATSPAPLQEAKVKFFNARKGYGFVITDKENREAFLHVTVLQRAGLATLERGESLQVRIGPNEKLPGKHMVTEVRAP